MERRGGWKGEKDGKEGQVERRGGWKGGEGGTKEMFEKF